MGCLAIIADDLSSATDCGIQVAKAGLRTLVPLQRNQIASSAGVVDVISINTDSRALPPSVAYQCVNEAARAVVSAGFQNIYKSLDSTLRGNLGAEIDAVLDVFDADLAVIAPAFPLYGRTTVDGMHFLDGRLITLTEFATDPDCPVKEADVVKLFSSQSKRKVGLVHLSSVRGGSAAIIGRLEVLLREGVELVVFDAQVEADLDRIANAVASSKYRPLWVGSTGMARCIPSTIESTREEGLQLDFSSATDLGMLVVGSASGVTREQLATLLSQRHVHAVEMNPLQIVRGGESRMNELELCRSRLTHALSIGKDVVLHVSSSRKAIAATRSLGLELRLDPNEVPTIIVTALAHIAHQIVDVFSLRGVILTGGDTARAVCEELGGVGIEVWEEVEPGIPIGLLVGNHELLVITKAGAFGTPEALVKSLDGLKRGDQSIQLGGV